MEVLTVAVPLESLIDRFARRALGELLADPESTAGRVGFAFLLGEATDPSCSAIVGAMVTKDLVHPAHEPERQLGVVRRSHCMPEAEERADREGVGPQVALLQPLRREARALCEPRHQFDRLLGALSHAVAVWPWSPPTGFETYFFCRRGERLRTGTRSVRTGTVACRTTFSATLPMRKWARPVRPEVAMMMQSWSRDAWRIPSLASLIWTRTVTGGPSLPRAFSTNRSSCLRCSGMRSPGSGIPNGTSAGRESGTSMCSTVSLPPWSLASRAAVLSAAVAWGEKSWGTRMLRKRLLRAIGTPFSDRKDP